MDDATAARWPASCLAKGAVRRHAHLPHRRLPGDLRRRWSRRASSSPRSPPSARTASTAALRDPSGNHIRITQRGLTCPPSIALLGLGRGGRALRACDLREAGVWASADVNRCPRARPDAAKLPRSAADGADIVLSAAIRRRRRGDRRALRARRPGVPGRASPTSTPARRAQGRARADRRADGRRVRRRRAHGAGARGRASARRRWRRRRAEPVRRAAAVRSACRSRRGVAAGRRRRAQAAALDRLEGPGRRWSLEATAAGVGRRQGGGGPGREILGILAEADEALVERMLTGSRTHATAAHARDGGRRRDAARPRRAVVDERRLCRMGRWSLRP